VADWVGPEVIDLRPLHDLLPHLRVQPGHEPMPTTRKTSATQTKGTGRRQ
jgi:hypothetical protein